MSLDFALGRLINEKQAGEGSNLPPRQFGDIRVPIVSNLKILKIDNYAGGTTFTLGWTDPEFANVSVAQYNIFVSGIDGVTQPQGPYSAKKSPAVIKVSARVASNLIFTVQTQLTNGLTSPLSISTSVAAETISPLRTGTLLGSRIAANFNSTADQIIPIAANKYIPRHIIALNASISLTTAAGGIYPDPAKAGSPLVAAAQVYSALTAPSKYLDLTTTALVGTDVFTDPILYFSLTTAQGSAATGDIFIFGDIVS